jgi:YVTN family beta-propeller protein
MSPAAIRRLYSKESSKVCVSTGLRREAIWTDNLAQVVRWAADSARYAASGRLLVLSKGDLVLAVVDPATLQVVGKVPSGPDPHEVTASSDGRTAYISNYGAGRGGFNTLTVADLVAFKPLPPVDLGPLRGPHGLATADGKIYFTAEVNKAIGRYDTATRQIDWVLGTGQDITHMIVVSKDGQRIFTVNVRSATASIIEASDGSQAIGGRSGRFAPGSADWTLTSVKIGEPAEDYEGFDVSPDGRELWTASPRSGRIAIVDVVEKKLKHTIDAGVTGANRVKFTLDGRHVLVSRLSIPPGASGSSVVVFDAASRKELKQINGGSGVAGILMQPDGTRAYAASSRDHIVSVIDLKTLEVIGRIDGGLQPDGLAWAVVR